MPLTMTREKDPKTPTRTQVSRLLDAIATHVLELADACTRLRVFYPEFSMSTETEFVSEWRREGRRRHLPFDEGLPGIALTMWEKQTIVLYFSPWPSTAMLPPSECGLVLGCTPFSAISAHSDAMEKLHDDESLRRRWARMTYNGTEWTTRPLISPSARDESKNAVVAAPLTSDSCAVCMDAPINAVFLECGHVSCCFACAGTLKSCPICRKPIARIIQLFIGGAQ